MDVMDLQKAVYWAGKKVGYWVVVMVGLLEVKKDVMDLQRAVYLAGRKVDHWAALMVEK